MDGQRCRCRSLMLSTCPSPTQPVLMPALCARFRCFCISVGHGYFTIKPVCLPHTKHCWHTFLDKKEFVFTLYLPDISHIQSESPRPWHSALYISDHRISPFRIDIVTPVLRLVASASYLLAAFTVRTSNVKKWRNFRQRCRQSEEEDGRGVPREQTDELN